MRLGRVWIARLIDLSLLPQFPIQRNRLSNVPVERLFARSKLFRYDIEMKKNKPDETATNELDKSDSQMEVVEKVDSNQMQHFVTSIKTAEQQVGENIIQALQHDGTVAVLTTVVMGLDGQRIVTAALKPELMQQVQTILMNAQEEREEEEPCVGFHCLVKPKQKITDTDTADNKSPKA